MERGKKPRFFYGYIVVSAAFFIVTVMWGSLYAFGIFFEPLLTEFDWTRAMTSGAFSLSFIMFGLLGMISGRLTDRFGPKIVVISCGSVLGTAYILISRINAPWQIYLFYGVMVAIGMSGCVVPLASTVSRWFISRRGMMTGLVVSGVGAGTLIVPLIANRLLSLYGWRTSYFILGIAVLILVVLSAQFIRRDPSQIRQLPLGKSELGSEDVSWADGLTLREAIKTRQLWMVGGSFFCFTLGLGAIMVHIVPHAIDLGISATGAAVILTIIGGTSIVGRVVVGIASDKIGYKFAVIIGLTLIPISFFWLLFADELWQLYLFAVVFGFGYGAVSAGIFPLAAEYFGMSSHGVILGFLLFGGESGNAIGAVLTGYIYDMTSSYAISFLALAIISFIGIVPVLRTRPVVFGKP